MPFLSLEFRRRWRSKHHVGAYKPVQKAFIRKGTFHRAYRAPFTFLDGSTESFAEFNRSGRYRGHKPHGAWCNYWFPESDYVELPNLVEVEIHQDFQSKGISTATVQIENVFYQAIAGVLGQYHMFKRGYFAPYRGFHAKNRPRYSWEQVNEWARLLAGSRQITVHQGYGEDEMVKSFTGLVDDVDMTSSPDHITITVRDFGGAALTEQRLFGQNKDPILKAPITFADRRHNEKIIAEGRHPKASSDDGHHHPRGIMKRGHKWISQARVAADRTEWIEIHLPRGKYEDFFVDPVWGGMEAWISVFCRGRRHRINRYREHVDPPRVDGVVVPEGWYDPGRGTVPGTTYGGVPWCRHYKRIDAKGHHGSLGHKFELGEGSMVRISFRNLHRSKLAGRVDESVGDDSSTNSGLPEYRYRAGVQRFVAYRHEVKEAARKNHWILVDDAADVVKVILRWAGFREWIIEPMGARIAKDKPWVFHQADFYMDVIDYVLSQGNYVFFMDDPSDHDESIGVPTFRRQHAVGERFTNLPVVRDRDLIEGIQVKESATPKASIIRVRGREAKKDEKRGTHFFDEDTTRTIYGVYTPPWTLRHEHGGIMRIEVHPDPLIETPEQAKVMCILIAIQEALAAHTGTIDTPGWPGPGLDDQIAVVDEGTGTNTRLYVTSRASRFTSGDQLKWTTTLGGSLIDVADIAEMVPDLKRAETAARHRREMVGIGTAVHERKGFRGGWGDIDPPESGAWHGTL